ncbi:MAG: O-antigen ligase family protein, partial [Allorhizobium sp.]
QSIFQGQRAAPLFHNNSIHAGVGSAMLFISSLFWVLYVLETKPFSRRWQLTCLILGSSTALLSLVGVLGAQSKGAWVALAATAGFLFILALLHRARKSKLSLLAILAVSVVISTTIALPSVEKVAGPTMNAASKLFQASMQSQPPLAVLEAGIKDPATPQAMRERLVLWTNALELINASPIIGWGNLWLREWRQTRYSGVGYTLLHNGYLEILVRHGIFGIAFLVLFASVAASRINAARVNGTIATSLAAYLYSMAFFFFCTIATNSNNRLALGESFFILAGSAIFALTLLNKNPGGGGACFSEKASEETGRQR